MVEFFPFLPSKVHLLSSLRFRGWLNMELSILFTTRFRNYWCMAVWACVYTRVCTCVCVGQERTLKLGIQVCVSSWELGWSGNAGPTFLHSSSCWPVAVCSGRTFISSLPSSPSPFCLRPASFTQGHDTHVKKAADHNVRVRLCSQRGVQIPSLLLTGSLTFLCIHFFSL